jgi:predicted membrane metal-binding protein
VKKAQLVGGVVLLVLAALIFVLLESGASVPAAITLTVVGLVLVATARKRDPRQLE